MMPARGDWPASSEGLRVTSAGCFVERLPG